jgi:O-antigen ligase
MKRRVRASSRDDSARSEWLDRILFWDLIAAVVLSVLAFGTVEPWSIAIFEINALLVAILLALKYVIGHDWNWGRLRLTAPVFGLVLVGVLQLAPFGSAVFTAQPENIEVSELAGRSISLDRQATREATVKILALAFYFAGAIVALRGAQRRKLALFILTGFGFLTSLFAIIHRLTSNGKMYWVRTVSDYIAPYGPYGNYNHFAGFVELILPLPFAYLLFARVNLERRVLWLFSVVIMASALIFSLSRGGILAMSVEILILLAAVALNSRGRSRESSTEGRGNWLMIGGILAAVTLTALWIGYDRLVDRFQLTRQGASEFSVVTRVEYWRASWKMFLDHPMTGVGLGAFPAIYPQYGRSTAAYERVEQTHNDYLQLLTDAGLLGAALALWFLLEIALIARGQLKQYREFNPRTRAMILGGYTAIAGIMVHSLTDFNLQLAANALLFLFVTAIATSARSNHLRGQLKGQSPGRSMDESEENS